MSDETDTVERLARLRASIDAIDHALVNLLAERRALVAEVFAFKVTHGLPLVDPARESALLAERALFAEARGVPPILATRMFQDILESSHDEAAAVNLSSGRDLG
ncbi:MAG: chorismate mutase [Polyangiaceae bacterium]